MAWIAVDQNGDVWITSAKPYRVPSSTGHGCWEVKDSINDGFQLEAGGLELLLGRQMTWADEPIEIKLVELNNK